MLQSIREHAQGWIAGIIIGLIILTFALWGINSYFSAASTVDVAVVNGAGISKQKFQRELANSRRQLQQMLGERADPSLFEGTAFKQQVLDRLIDQELLRQVATENGMRISDAQVAAAINSFQAFQVEGSFSQTQYERTLRNIGLSPLAFEQQMRIDMMVEQLRMGVADSPIVIRPDVEELLRLREQQRSFGFAILRADGFRDQVQPSEEDLEAFYQAHRDDYMTEEKVAIEYVVLSLEEMAKQVKVTEEELKRFYEENKASWTLPEERNASHILIKVAADASEEEVEAARKKAVELLEQVRKGESFEELAKKASDDAGSRENGGSLGWFARGFMVPGFDEKVFEMEKGELAGPVRTTFGWHIIRLNDIRPARVEPFEQVRKKVEEAYRKKEAEALYYDKADELATLAFENPDSLEEVADSLGLELKQSGLMTRVGGEGVLAENKVLDTAFNPELIAERVNSEPIELEGNRLVVLRVVDHQSASHKPFEAVREQVREDYVSARAKELAKARGDELLARLRGGEERSSVIDSAGLKWNEVKRVTREAEDIQRAVLRAAFRIGRPADRPLYEGVPMGAGDYALVEVTEVIDPEPSSFNGVQLAETRREIEAARSAASWADLLATLRARAEIEVFLDKL